MSFDLYTGYSFQFAVEERGEQAVNFFFDGKVFRYIVENKDGFFGHIRVCHFHEDVSSDVS